MDWMSERFEVGKQARGIYTVQAAGYMDKGRQRSARYDWGIKSEELGININRKQMGF